MKIRYKKQRKNIKIQRDDSYFKTRINRNKSQQESYLNHKKNKTIDLSQLCFDYKKLQPNKSIGTNCILDRQRKINPSNGSEVKRRNAILLDNDLHYQRFIKEIHRNNKSDGNQKFIIQEQKKITQALNRNKLFTMNYQALKKRKNNQKIPNSITEYQGIVITPQPLKYTFEKGNRDEIRKQEEQQDNYRMKGNAQAQRAYSMMQNFSTTKSYRSKKTKISNQTKIRSQSLKNNGQNSPRLQINTKNSINLFNFQQGTSPQVFNQLTKSTLQKTSSINKQQNLGKKVLKLLQNIKVQSQTVNLQMTRFELHPQFLQQKIFDPKNIAHKWIKKAQQQIVKKNFQIALDCYKQAMILEPDFFNPVYNFATILEKQNRFTSCLQWFKLAKQFETDNQKVVFAISIILFKMEKYEQCFNQINSLINFLGIQKKAIDTRYLYMRALCYKKFEKYDLAKQDYISTLQISRPTNYANITNFLFSQIFAKKRRLKINLDCLAFVNFTQIAQLSLYEKSQRFREQTSQELVSNLLQAPFFKRFSSSLIQKIVSKSHYQYIQKDSVIFVKPEQCMIVIDGIVLINNHQKNILNYDITCLLKGGDFVGAKSIDSQKNKNLNNWYFAYSDAEILKISSEEFQSLWKGQITFQVDYMYNFLKNITLFDKLPESTLFKLCEFMKLQTYSKGTILYNDCSYQHKFQSKIGEGFSLIRSKIQNQIISNSQTPQKALTSFDRVNYKGLYIIKSGKFLIQDNLGFKNQDIISSGDFFGENLIIISDGFHNYGRIVVQSQTAQLYVLKLQDIPWFFSKQDKQIMRKNCQNIQKRKSLELVKSLRKRYHQFLQVKKKYKIDND